MTKPALALPSWQRRLDPASGLHFAIRGKKSDRLATQGAIVKKILIACDGSENALRAVRYAAQENHGLEFDLLHVLDPVTFTSPAALLSPDELSRLCPDQADRMLRPARRILEAAAVGYQMRCRVGAAVGAAADDIANEVHDSNCKGGIMGTRGMGPIASAMIGSVASGVVQLLDVPLTLIK